jgi:outer membrane protein assembly factor BamB
VLGVGITTLAALGGMGFAGKLLFLTPPQPNLFLPLGHQPTATALPGASRIRWTFSIYPQPFGLPTSLALAGQTLICAGNKSLTAVNSTDGKFLWIQRQVNFNTDVPPTIMDDSIYVTYINETFPTQDNEVDNVYLAALNVANGSEKWHQVIATVPVQDLNFTSTSAITIDEHSAYVRVNQTLYACDAATGKVRWSQSAGTAAVDLGEILPAPTVAGNTVFAILGDRHLHAFSTLDGAPLWPAPFVAALPSRTQPVVANGMVYVGADGGGCYALDAATGAIRWQQQLLKSSSGLDLTRFTSLGLTLSENVLYISGGFPFEDISSDPKIHGTAIQALDPATGKILWSNSPNEKLNLQDSSLFLASPVIAGNRVFVASTIYPTTSSGDNGPSINILYALNTQDGKVAWTTRMWGLPTPYNHKDGVPSAPVVSGDTLYIISGNEMLYALSYAD